MPYFNCNMIPEKVEHTGAQILHSAPHKKEIQEISLLFQAVGIEHQIERAEGQFILKILEKDRAAAEAELRHYQIENKNWPRRPEKKSENDSRSTPAFLIVSAFFIFFQVTGPWSMHSPWFIAGMNDATAIKQGGEWFRLITALTLHADLSHLLGNCLLGGFLLHFFLKNSGYGIGIFAVFLVGAAGNGLNVYFRSSPHLSVGFSTAVFGMLGMMVFISYVHNKESRSRYYSPLIPFFAALALLALLGTSGERTDLGAHFFGFVTGIFAGCLVAAPYITRLRQVHFIQLFFFSFTIFLVLKCWLKAYAAIT